MDFPQSRVQHLRNRGILLFELGLDHFWRFHLEGKTRSTIHVQTAHEVADDVLTTIVLMSLSMVESEVKAAPMYM